MKQTHYALMLAVAVVITLTLVSSVAQSETANSASTKNQNQESTGDTVLYFPIFQTSISSELYDMVDYMTGDGRIFEVQHSWGPQHRHQSQFETGRFYHTKGNDYKAEWEELWATSTHILRGTDTSPGNNQYYTLREHGNYGSLWSPRFWKVGDLFERNPLVTFYDKDNCGVIISGTQKTWLKFEAFHPNYTFTSNITLYNVVELAWLLSPQSQPAEKYFYAKNYGLVGWMSSDGRFSYISEEHAPGARPDNAREPILCLDLSGHPEYLDPLEPIGPLPPPYRAK